MKSLLFIAHRVPYPPDKGERVRALHEIQALAGHFEVTVAALAHGGDDLRASRALGRWCRKVVVAPAGGAAGLCRGGVALLGGRSVTEGYFASGLLREAIAAQVRRRPFDLVFGYSSGVLPHVLAVPAATVRIIDLVDADSAKWAAYAQQSRWPMEWFYRREAQAVRQLEQTAVERCQAVVLVSRAEAGLLGLAEKNIHVAGNGVDVDYFSPRDRPAGPAASIVFTGSMGYRPNVDGVCWFVQAVWPGLRRQCPGLTFQIVGRDPAPAVRRLAAVPGVRVTGSVPDVRPLLAAATLVVVPLRVARGVQNKVLEAMASGRAVVASPIALEGLEVEVGAEALAAESPEQWRRCVGELVGDPGRRAEVERAARACVLAKYRWADRMAPLVALCDRLAEGRHA